jgi:hypothetical protein
MRKLALLALVAAAACSDTAPSASPPQDKFYYPTGIALTKLDDGHTALLVASSNFDLQYDLARGGTVISVDVDATLAQAGSGVAEPLQPVIPANGFVSIGSFAGELAIVDESTCNGWETQLGQPREALVASRSQDQLYRVVIKGDGSLECGDSCVLPLDAGSADPYGVTVACGQLPPIDATGPGAAPAPQAYAFVTYLRTPASDGRLSQFDLASGRSRLLELGFAPTHSAAFDPSTTRFFVTSRFGAPATSPLRWITLATPGTTAAFDLETVIRGSEQRGIALSSASVTSPPPAGLGLAPRAYVALRLFDEDLATTLGARPTADIGGALAVLDLSQQANGAPAMTLVKAVPVGLGANEVRVIPRAGQRDLVVVSSTDDGTVSLYDDETGTVARVFELCPDTPDPSIPAPCPAGRPSLGKQPFGLAVEQPFTRRDVPDTKLARLYVGSFDRSWVNVIEIDPLHPGARDVHGVPLRWDRIGRERL